ncbi:MAG: FtsX-like permease family protein, partial [Planctomycetota bacterium]
VRTFALVDFQTQGQSRQQNGVNVVGLPMDRIDAVTGFHDSLYLNHPADAPTVPLQDLADAVDAQREDELARLRTFVDEGVIDAEQFAEREKLLLESTPSRVEQANIWAKRKLDGERPTFDLPWEDAVYERYFAGQNRPEGVTPPPGYPGLIAGTGLLGLRKDADGNLNRWYGLSPDNPILVKMATLDVSGGINRDIQDLKRELTLWLVDNSRTGVFAQDNDTVYVDFDLLQRTLGMVPEPRLELDENFQPTGRMVERTKRTGELHIALAPGIELLDGRERVDAIVDRVLVEHDKLIEFRGDVRVETWEETYAAFLGAVEKEKALVTTLFGFISIVAIFLILCIFYMIVKEKTRDIGILKSVGATRLGIATIFLGYGAAIGVVGGLMGLGVGWLIVRYINEIHDLMGAVLGLQIWNAQTYLFDKIPNTMNPVEATVIVAAAVISSIVGAVIPALLAARLRPVEALRFE